MDKCDHRVIGNDLDLFHQQDEGPGVVFWHPRGTELWRIVEAAIRKRMRKAGFGEVRSPQLLARSLWEKSGHWEKFSDGMFDFGDGERHLALKPMSCPGHIQIFNKRVRSFRDLPLRYAEFGACHRNEPSGALQGLMRTRAFVQDDAHIFCTEDQIAGEVASFAAMLAATYADFGFGKPIVGFSTRPEVRAGDDATWDKAEKLLSDAARAAGLDPLLKPGEGAFYGPKLEFALCNSRGRLWQCGTIQLDFVLPERLDAVYVGPDNSRRRPAMLHQAVLGSIERFIAILLEHHEGKLPLRLAPEQIVVATVTDAALPWAARVYEAFVDADFRVRLDDRSERIGRKVANARELGIPVLLAIGEAEMRSENVTLRRDGAALETLTLARALERLGNEAFR